MTYALYSDDLFWSSKIIETAKALGHAVVRAKSLGEVEKLAPDVLIVDLNTRDVDVTALRAAAPAAKLRAFGRHTDEDGLARARAAGCEPVLARSALQARLPEYLGEWLGKRV
jgi:hypothetical protein